MNLDEMRAGASFQVQTTRDGVTWDPRQPHPKGIDTLANYLDLNAYVED